MTSGPVLEVEGLTVTFSTPDGPVHAVRGVDFFLGEDEVLGVIGESGSGKSVTMLAVMGLLPRTATVTGSVRYRGRELLGLPEAELRRYRGAKLAMIFQDPMTSLNPVLKVGKQIAEAMLTHRVCDKREARDRAVELLRAVGIPRADQRFDDYPHQFSGGMRQRVMIAMAMANDPDVLIADEPTTALDVTIQAQILEVLETAQERTGAGVLLITHDLGLVAGVADRVEVMYAGRIVEEGSLDQIYYESRHPYSRGLMACLPRLDQRGRRLEPIGGAPPSLMNLPSGCVFHPRCPYRTDLCTEQVPALRPVDVDLEHRSACHYAEELPRLAPRHEVEEVG